MPPSSPTGWLPPCSPSELACVLTLVRQRRATGSGKTHTIMGSIAKGVGIIPRSIEHLFATIQVGQERPTCVHCEQQRLSNVVQENRGSLFSVHMSYVELYNDQFRDLLDSNSAPGTRSRREATRGCCNAASVFRERPQARSAVRAADDPRRRQARSVAGLGGPSEPTA